MKSVIKIELERAFRSKGMLIALLVGNILGIIQYVNVVIPRSKNILGFLDPTAHTYPYSVFNSWFGVSDLHPCLSIYLTIFPIIATLPYGVSYLEDQKKGVIKSICTRTKKSHYLIAKYIAVFLSGGFVVVVPMLINLMLTASALPSLLPTANGLFQVGGVGMFAKLFYTHPYLYILLYMVMYFLYGGVFASIALACTHLFDYSFFVILFPFIIYYGMGLISGYVYSSSVKNINPHSLLKISQPSSVMEVAFFGEVILLGILALSTYIWKGVRHDIF